MPCLGSFVLSAGARIWESIVYLSGPSIIRNVTFEIKGQALLDPRTESQGKCFKVLQGIFLAFQTIKRWIVVPTQAGGTNDKPNKPCGSLRSSSSLSFWFSLYCKCWKTKLTWKYTALLSLFTWIRNKFTSQDTWNHVSMVLQFPKTLSSFKPQ